MNDEERRDALVGTIRRLQDEQEDSRCRIAALKQENKLLREAGLAMLNDYALARDGFASRQRMHALLEKSTDDHS